MSSNILTERDTNPTVVDTKVEKESFSTATTGSTWTEKSTNNELAENINTSPRRTNTYISPSDNILSPASQKLAELRCKQQSKGYVRAAGSSAPKQQQPSLGQRLRENTPS